MGLLVGAYANVAAAAEPPFAAPSGFQGAGLGMGDQKGRAWLETAFHTQERVTVFGTTLGAGYRVADSLELEAMLPFAFASLDQYTFDNATYELRRERESAFALGNPYLGVNRVHVEGALRYKAGLGVTLPVAADENPTAMSAVALSAATYGMQDMHLWWPNTFTVVAPLRIEVGEQVVAGIDAAPAFLTFTTDDVSEENELLLQLAPGLGVYATDTLLIGARLPMWWLATSEGDNAQVALEPYARLDVGGGFLNARFTVNLDEPLGFAFDEGRYWGAHLGGGLVF